MNCPECAGPTLYNWVMRHTNACTIRDAEDATQNADRDRLDRLPRGFTRRSTAAELTLVTAAGYVPDEQPLTAVTWRAYRYRVIDGHATP